MTGAAQLAFYTNGSATSNRSTLIGPSDFSITYNASAAHYALAEANEVATFGSSEFTKETSVPDYFPRVEFARHGTGTDDYLVIFKAPNATPPVTPRFGAYGAWQHNTNMTASTEVRLVYFAYGSPTPASAMPHSGTVRYRLTGTANFADDSRLFFAENDTTVTVDFAANTVSGVLTLTGTDFFGDNLGGLIGFRLPGTIAGSEVNAPIDSDIATMIGHFHLQFLGPNAEEVELTYEGNDGREAFAGATIGTRLN